MNYLTALILGQADPMARSWQQADSCEDLDNLDLSRLQGNIKKLINDFGQAERWYAVAANPAKGKGLNYPQAAADHQAIRAMQKAQNYMELGAADCVKAKALLDLIKKCCGPFTSAQQAAFDALRIKGTGMNGTKISRFLDVFGLTVYPT